MNTIKRLKTTEFHLMKSRNFFRASPLLIIAVFLFGIAAKESEIGAKSANDIARRLENGEVCSNYIDIIFGEKTTYSGGFTNFDIHNKGISDIYVNGIRYGPTDKITIPANLCFKLCFDDTITSLSEFFNSNKDNNLKNMKSVDLSHFDSSSITSVRNMFKDCTSLESINFANFKTTIQNKNNFNNILSGSFENLTFIDVNDATKDFIDAINQNQIIQKNHIEVCDNRQCQREQSCPIIKPEIIPTTQPTVVNIL